MIKLTQDGNLYKSTERRILRAAQREGIHAEIWWEEPTSWRRGTEPYLMIALYPDPDTDWYDAAYKITSSGFRYVGTTREESIEDVPEWIADVDRFIALLPLFADEILDT